MKFKSPLSRREQIAALKPGESCLFIAPNRNPGTEIQRTVSAELSKYFQSVDYTQQRVLIVISEHELPIAATILTRVN